MELAVTTTLCRASRVWQHERTNKKPNTNNSSSFTSFSFHRNNYTGAIRFVRILYSNLACQFRIANDIFIVCVSARLKWCAYGAYTPNWRKKNMKRARRKKKKFGVNDERRVIRNWRIYNDLEMAHSDNKCLFDTIISRVHRTYLHTSSTSSPVYLVRCFKSMVPVSTFAHTHTPTHLHSNNIITWSDFCGRKY